VSGLVMATLLSIVAVVVYITRGPDAFTRLGVSLPSVVALYLLAGGGGECLWGSCFRLLRGVGAQQ